MNDQNIDSTNRLIRDQVTLIGQGHVLRSGGATLDTPAPTTYLRLRYSAMAILLAACNFPRPADIIPDAAPDADADVSDAPETPPPDGPVATPHIVASNTVSRADLVAGIEPLMIPAGKTYVIDTDQGGMFDASNSNAPVRFAGPGLRDGIFYRTDDQNRAFFAVQSLTLGENAILRGVGGRALILIADGPIEIHGIIDVSAGHCSPTSDSLACAGPGGGRGGDTSAASGCSPGQVGAGVTGSCSGSGGGGYASPGGAGGASNAGGTSLIAGGAAGTGAACPGLSLVPIQGGSGGASGAGASSTRLGGGGGGALQLTSYTSISFFSPATPSTSGVWAGGAGGTGGAPGGSAPVAGSGGGSGGAILLEATAIEIRSGVTLASNGGGGGAGAVANDGQPGQFGTAPASGGAAAPGGVGAGGVGAALNSQASSGGLGVAVTNVSSAAGGGGGGGVGRIRINAVALTNLSAQAVISPAPSLNVPADTE